MKSISTWASILTVILFSGVLIGFLLFSMEHSSSRRKFSDYGLAAGIFLTREFHALLDDSKYQEAFQLTCEAKEKDAVPLGPREIRALQQSFPYRGTTLKSSRELILRDSESYGMYELTLEDKSGIRLSNLIVIKRGQGNCISLTQSAPDQASVWKF